MHSFVLVVINRKNFFRSLNVRTKLKPMRLLKKIIYRQSFLPFYQSLLSQNNTANVQPHGRDIIAQKTWNSVFHCFKLEQSLKFHKGKTYQFSTSNHRGSFFFKFSSISTATVSSSSNDVIVAEILHIPSVSSFSSHKTNGKSMQTLWLKTFLSTVYLFCCGSYYKLSTFHYLKLRIK